MMFVRFRKAEIILVNCRCIIGTVKYNLLDPISKLPRIFVKAEENSVVPYRSCLQRNHIVQHPLLVQP